MMTKLWILPVVTGVAVSPALAQVSEGEVVAAAEEAVEAAVAEASQASEAIEIVTEPAELPEEESSQAGTPFLLDFGALNIRQSDYPPASWAAGEEGTAYYSLTVDEQGNVSDCAIIESTGYEALDNKTCEIAHERGRFEPALDLDGNPVAGEHRDYQVWTRREPDFPGSATIHVEFTVNAEGRTVDCEVIDVSGQLSESMRRSFDREPCPGMNSENGVPYRDENGYPIAQRVNVMVVVRSEDIEE